MSSTSAQFFIIQLIFLMCLPFSFAVISYSVGAQVTFNGLTYESQHNCNVWEPPTLWEVVE